MGPVKYSKTPMVPFFLLNLPLGVYLFMTPIIPLQPHKNAFPKFLKFWSTFIKYQVFLHLKAMTDLYSSTLLATSTILLSSLSISPSGGAGLVWCGKPSACRLRWRGGGLHGTRGNHRGGYFPSGVWKILKWNVDIILVVKTYVKTFQSLK